MQQVPRPNILSDIFCRLIIQHVYVNTLSVKSKTENINIFLCLIFLIVLSLKTITKKKNFVHCFVIVYDPLKLF